MSPFVIATMVEGYGDVQAVPTLLRRLTAEAPGVEYSRPIRIKRSSIRNEEYLTKYLTIAEANICEKGGRGTILMILDGDEDCVATLSAELVRLSASVLPNRLCRAALPVREFESWTLGGTPSVTCEEADALGDTKGMLRKLHGRYRETADQARLIAVADLELLSRRSRSFRKLQKVMNEILAAAASD